MLIKFRVDRAAAVRGGHNKAGLVELDIDMAALAEEDRGLLAEAIEDDGFIKYLKGAGSQLFGITAAAPTVEGLFDAIHKTDAERTKHNAQREAAVAEELALTEREDAAALAAKRVKGYRANWEIDHGSGWRTLNYAKGREAELVTRNTPEWQAWVEEIAERNARERAENVEAERAARAEKDELHRQRQAAKEAEAAAWAEAHGSERLRRCIKEEIECEAIYKDERLAAERPGWRWYEAVPWKTIEARNPPAEAFAMLDEARKIEPQAYLQYVEWTPTGEDDYEEPETWRGYVAESVFLGETIVFGGPS